MNFKTGMSCAAAVLAAAPLCADPLTEGKPLGSFRLRAETVEQEGKMQEATALTLRSLVGWQTAPWKSLSATLQAGVVTALVDDYDDFARGVPQPGRSGRPRIADPALADMNLAYVDWAPSQGVTLRAGRQSLKFDNSRHVGTVEFRQTMQVLDGVLLEARAPLPRTTLSVGSFAGLRQITGRYQPADLRLLNLRHVLPDGTQLGAYGYFVGWERTALAGTSSRTVGVRADGNRALTDDLKLLYSADVASQERWRNSTLPGTTTYQRLSLGLQRGNSTVRIERERLGSNAGRNAFQSPLGSNHAFQGSADLFLVTPDSGIDDLSLVAQHRKGPWQLSSEYHRMSADTPFTSLSGVSTDLGQELDIAVTWTQGPWMLRLEWAHFDEGAVYGATTAAPTRKRDTTKTWLTAQFTL